MNMSHIENDPQTIALIHRLKEIRIQALDLMTETNGENDPEVMKQVMELWVESDDKILAWSLRFSDDLATAEANKYYYRIAHLILMPVSLMMQQLDGTLNEIFDQAERMEALETEQP